MEYGILVVEDGNELYQIIGVVFSLDETIELARNYEWNCGPEVPGMQVPPTQYVLIRRDPKGYYTLREVFTLNRADVEWLELPGVER